MSLQVITANRLIDGAVVYFTPNDAWSPWIADARTLGDEATRNTAMAQAQASVENNEVVDAYLIDVALEAQTVKPVRYRETIRAKGPSTHSHMHASRLVTDVGNKPVPSGAVAAGTAVTTAFLNGI